jgi:hypothetical protein
LDSIASNLEKAAKPWRWLATMTGIGIFCIWLVVLLNVDLRPVGFALFMLMIVILLIVNGVQSELTDHARRLRVENMEEKVRQDNRPPVVYLRSFDRDAEAAKIHKTRISYHGGGTPYTFVSRVGTTTGSEEDLLKKFFDRVGPVVSIGNPDDTTTMTGAARHYVDAHKNWREVVESLIDKAVMVILHAGNTEGLLWELETVVRKKPPQRILVLISFTTPEYYKFRERTAKYFRPPLPDYNAVGTVVPSSIKGFIQFDADWTSTFVRMPWRLRDALANADGEAYLDVMLPKIFQPFLSRLEALNSTQPFRSYASSNSNEEANAK